MDSMTNRDNSQMTNMSQMAFIRIFHTVVDAPAVDVYADDQLLVRDLSFGEYTDYLSVPVKNYVISVYPAGTMDTPVATNMLSLTDDKILTIAATGRLQDISLLVIPDATTSMIRNRALIRFIHLSPNAPAVDITLPDGTILFTNVSFEQRTAYLAFPADNYTVQVRLTGTDTVVLTVPDLRVTADDYYSIYAIGLVNGRPALEAVLLQDS